MWTIAVEETLAFGLGWMYSPVHLSSSNRAYASRGRRGGNSAERSRESDPDNPVTFTDTVAQFLGEFVGQ
jgi:hypothetical protein